jgi:hypothetical protein
MIRKRPLRVGEGTWEERFLWRLSLGSEARAVAEEGKKAKMSPRTESGEGICAQETSRRTGAEELLPSLLLLLLLLWRGFLSFILMHWKPREVASLSQLLRRVQGQMATVIRGEAEAESAELRR